eukprot:PhM_4_TR1382/c0_g1_i1/m.12787/K10758/QSOX; thiol oxidase
MSSSYSHNNTSARCSLSLAVVVAVLAFVSMAPPNGVSAVSLYVDSPFVVEVNTMPTFEKCPWYLVFYVSWCGHCQSFAPHYKHFAQTLMNDTFGTVAASFDCVRYEKKCNAYNITDYPTVMYYDGDAVHKLNVRGTDFDKGSPAHIDALHTPETHKHCVTEKYHRLKEAHIQNANTSTTVQFYNPYLSFHYSLKHEVPSAVLAATKGGAAGAAALDETQRKELEILNKFLKHAYQAMPSLRSPKGPGGDKGCGFTCGMWRLYHTMVEGPEPVEALKAIRDYVGAFFKCVTCRKHFGEMAQNIDKVVWDAASARMWLWRAHNRVNMRLHKPFYPTRTECSVCTSDDDVDAFLVKRYRAVPKASSEMKPQRVLAGGVVDLPDATTEEPNVDTASSIMLAVLLFVVALVVGCVCSRRISRKSMEFLGFTKKHDL